MLCVAGKDFFAFRLLAWLGTKRNQPRSVGVRGRETSAFEMVLSPEAKQNKFMAALRWLVSHENR